jgi:putative peptidoglycan lipid II flippase
MKIFGAIRKRLRNLNPDHHAIFRGIVWVALFVFIGKLAGAAKEMAIAYRYGVSNDVDAYLFIFNLISWPVSVWFSILTYVLVPLAARIRDNAPDDLPRFRAELLAIALVLGVDLALIAWFGLPALLRSSWLGLSESTVRIAINIVPSMVALAPLGVLVSLFSAWMLSSGRHANTLLESVPAMAILVAVLVLPNNGVEPLVWGTLAGFMLHAFTLASPLIWKGELEKPQFTSQSPQWLSFWHGFGMMLVGSGLGSLVGIIDQFFAAQLDTGTIATISYANRILALVLGLGATAIGRATLPVFSRIKSQNGGQLQRVAMLWVGLMFVIGIISMIVSWWLAPWIVKLLFERGAFLAADTKIVTEVFRYGLVQVPFYFPALVLVTLLASHGKHKLLAISGGTNLFVKVCANYLLVPLLGMNGIILSSGIMYMVSLFLLFWFGNSFLKHNEPNK